MSGELRLGFARGLRQGIDQGKAEKLAADERAYQRGRQERADARVDEASAYERAQRPQRERLQAAQVATAEATEATRQRTVADAARAAEQEGFLDLVKQLDEGTDPNTAVSGYNARGAHKIKSFQYDARSGNLSFVDEDGPQQGNVKQIRRVLEDSLTPSTAKRQLTKVGDHERVIDGTGREIARGPLYGKDKEAGGSKAPMHLKPGDAYRDTVDGKWKYVPQDPAGGSKKSGTTATGAKVGAWSRQAAQKSVREILAAKVGLKYDPQTEQITGGKPGATDAWLELSAKGDEVIDKVTDSMGPAQIAHMVTDAYSGVRPAADYEKEVTTGDGGLKRQKWFDPRSPDNVTTFDEPEDKFQGRIKSAAAARRQAALDSAEQRLNENLRPFIPVGDAQPAGASGDIEDGQGDESDGGDGGDGSEGETPNPDDYAPAVERGAAPAAAAGFQQQWANPPGMTGRGNLDPWNRKVLNNPDGSVSTTSSMSIGTDQGEVLIPTVVDGKRLSKQQAIDHFKQTGEHLGVFDTPDHADAYAEALHNEQARRMGLGGGGQAAAGLGPRAHYPVTADRVTAGADVQAQSALKVVQADPRYLRALQQPAEQGRATVVKFPDGNVYYLAGTEIKRLNMKPPTKGK